MKIAFSLKRCITTLPEFNQLLDFFNLFDSRLVLMLVSDSLSLVINAFSYRDYWGHGSGERKSISLQQLDFVACTTHHCGFPLSHGNAEALDRMSGENKASSDFLLSQ